MKIRPVEPWDVPALFNLAERFHSEASPGFPVPDAEAIHRTVLETKLTNQLCCFVAEDGNVIGFLTGAYCRFPHSFSMVAGLTMFYITPEKRGGLAAGLLVKRFINWSREVGAVVVCGGSISGIKEERFGKFFERAGFRRAGVTYMRTL